MSEDVGGYLYNVIKLGEIWDEAMAPVYEAIDNQKKAEQKIQELEVAYTDLHSQWSEAQQKACKLSGDCNAACTELIDTLIWLFGESTKYYCPDCGKKLFLGNKKTMACDDLYYLHCKGCKHEEPSFDSVREAYLDWFHKCKRDRKE